MAAAAAVAVPHGATQGLCEYDQIRARNIAANEAKLASSG